MSKGTMADVSDAGIALGIRVTRGLNSGTLTVSQAPFVVSILMSRRHAISSALGIWIRAIEEPRGRQLSVRCLTLFFLLTQHLRLPGYLAKALHPIWACTGSYSSSFRTRRGPWRGGPADGHRTLRVVTTAWSPRGLRPCRTLRPA